MAKNMQREAEGLCCAVVSAGREEDGRTVIEEDGAVHPLTDAAVMRIFERLHDVERTAEAQRFFCGLAAHPSERVRAAAVAAGCLSDDAWRRAARDPAYLVREAAAEFLGGLFPEALDPRIRAAAERSLEALRRFDEALAAAAGLDFLFGLRAGLAGCAPLCGAEAGEAAGNASALAAECIRRVMLEHRVHRLRPRFFNARLLGIGRLQDAPDAEDAADPEAGFVAVEPSLWLELIDLLEPETAGAALDDVAAQGPADERAAAARHEALTLERARFICSDPCARVRAALLENTGVACRLCAYEIEMLLHDERNKEEPPVCED